MLLAAGLVLPGIVAPAQAATQALGISSGDGAMAHSPCDGMSMPMHGTAPAKQPPGTQHGCDLSACLGAGCLPTMPHLTPHIPQPDVLIAWDEPVPASPFPETPLRPPIA